MIDMDDNDAVDNKPGLEGNVSPWTEKEIEERREEERRRYPRCFNYSELGEYNPECVDFVNICCRIAKGK